MERSSSARATTRSMPSTPQLGGRNGRMRRAPGSGQAKCVTSMAGRDITAPATAKGHAFFAVAEPAPLTSPSNRVTLYAINVVDGQVKWKFGAGKGYGTPHLLIADNIIYFRT